MISRTGMRVRREYVGTMQCSLSCDGSSYGTALVENGCTDIVSLDLRVSCSYQISARSEAISSRDPPTIVPRV